MLELMTLAFVLYCDISSARLVKGLPRWLSAEEVHEKREIFHYIKLETEKKEMRIGKKDDADKTDIYLR